jgi:hypothetical protein
MTRSTLLLSILLLVTAGCSTGAPPPPAPEVPEVGAEARRLVVPFDAYQLSVLDIHTIEYAEDLLTRDCMRRRNLDWTVMPPPAAEDPDPLNRRRYGLIEPEVADRFGYHLPPPTEAMAARQSIHEERERLPSDRRQAAYGADGKGGCRGEARARLRADIPDTDQSRLYDYSSVAFRQSQEHPDVRDVIRRWSDCLHATGVRYADPFEAYADPAWAESTRPSARESEVARADVTCKQAHDVVGVWSRVEHAIQHEAIRANPEDFDGFARVKAVELDAARRVLEQHG